MKPCTIGDRTWLVVAVVTVVLVFNWVCTGGLDLEIFGHFQTSQEKVFSRNFGTPCGGAHLGIYLGVVSTQEWTGPGK